MYVYRLAEVPVFEGKLKNSTDKKFFKSTVQIRLQVDRYLLCMINSYR